MLIRFGIFFRISDVWLICELIRKLSDDELVFRYLVYELTFFLLDYVKGWFYSFYDIFSNVFY